MVTVLDVVNDPISVYFPNAAHVTLTESLRVALLRDNSLSLFTLFTRPS